MAMTEETFPTNGAEAAVSVPWDVLESGLSGRSLIVSYLASSRAAGPGRVIVDESEWSVRIRVEQPVDGTPSHAPVPVAYTPMRRTPIVEVALTTPIGGRRIQGEGRAARPFRTFGYLWQPGPDTLRLPAVPRVIGLAPADALTVLAAQGFDAAVVGDGPEILEQDPKRGGVARNHQAAVCDRGPVLTLTTHVGSQRSPEA
jgi:hypothetical protein